jgi:hypothetical protein
LVANHARTTVGLGRVHATGVESTFGTGHKMPRPDAA